MLEKPSGLGSDNLQNQWWSLLSKMGHLWRRDLLDPQLGEVCAVVVSPLRDGD